MKKLFGIILVVMFMFSFSLVSAKTLITGTVYHEGDITNTIEGADVVVSCAHNTSSGIIINVKNTTSSNDGSYTVTFLESPKSGCDDGDIVTVTATKGDLYGESKPGVVEDNVFGNTWDFAMVHVPMVPEFGFFIGIVSQNGAQDRSRS